MVRRFKTLPFVGVQRSPWGIKGKGKHGTDGVEKGRVGGTERIAHWSSCNQLNIN